jgi:hypothetical protein
MADPAFRAQLEAYRHALSEADANPYATALQVHAIDRAWFATRLKQIHDQAMTLAAVGIDQDGREVFLKQPDHRARSAPCINWRTCFASPSSRSRSPRMMSVA